MDDAASEPKPSSSSPSHASPGTSTASQQLTPETTTSSVSIPDAGGLHPQSCALCAQRKVKCDRRDPTCANCVKARQPCEYRAPLPRGPRKRRHLNDEAADPAALAEKLAKCEELLRTLGISPDNVEAGKAYAASPAGKVKAEPDGGFTGPRGRLMAEDGKLRYVENTLWATVADEVPEDDATVTEEERPEGNLSFTTSEEPQQNSNHTSVFTDIAGSMVIGMPFLKSHPEHATFNVARGDAVALFDVFMDAVTPLSRIVHGPTIEKLHVFYLNRPDALPKRSQALLAGVYYSAANAMLEEQCQQIFGQSKRHVLPKYYTMCANALVEARFLGTIDIETLQGYVLFLLASRDKLDARSIWTLVGIAVRIGQYVGLHHDGDELKLTPFDTEMRRRLWWQIGMLEAAIGELSGFGPSTMITSSSTKPPTNLNDSDLDPKMEVLPPPRVGATDVIFVRLRTAAGHLARKHRIGSLLLGASINKGPNQQGVVKTLQKIIGEMEELIERDFLRYCDYLDPLHRLCSSTARVFLCRLRLKMYHPRRRKGAVEGLTNEEKDLCFDNARRIIMHDNSVLGDKSLAKYHWHVLAYFQWDALLYLFFDLRQRDVFDRNVVQVWEEIEQSFKYHINLIEDQSKVLHIAVAQMCLKAWAIKEQAHAARNPSDPILTRPPQFIQALRESESRRLAAHERRLAQGKALPGGAQRAQQQAQYRQAPDQQQPQPAQPAMDTSGYQMYAYTPSLSEGTMVNNALDTGMMDLNFNFGLSSDFNFTFESATTDPAAFVGNSDPNTTTAMEYDLWQNIFPAEQPPFSGQ